MGSLWLFSAMNTFFRDSLVAVVILCMTKETHEDITGEEGDEEGVGQTGTNTRLWTGNAAIDGGILGLGAGLLGGAVLGGLLTSQQPGTACEWCLVSCHCDYSLTWKDKYGMVQGACRTQDYNGKVWCYTTAGGAGCGDTRQSSTAVGSLTTPGHIKLVRPGLETETNMRDVKRIN